MDIAALLLCGALALALLAPLASNTTIPEPSDHAGHIGAIVQARMAMEEGQFPIRVAPWQHMGWRYPLFQFYSPLPYMAGGLVHWVVTPANPFLAYKIVLWGALLLGGFFIYRSADFLLDSPYAAMIAAIVYMTLPYILVNVHARGAFTEGVAQGVLPMALYASLRCCYAERAGVWLPLAGIAWCFLALSHNITFVWSAVFVGLLFAGLLFVGRLTSWRGPLRVAAAFGLGCLLALYFLAPVFTADYVQIRERFGNVFDSAWLTTLPSLLSPRPLPPEPQPVPGRPLPEHFSTAIGWPLLIGVAVFAARGIRPEPLPAIDARARRIGLALLGMFAVAFIAVWSPIDFWAILPKSAHVSQFSYRLLTHVGWAGALLCGYAALILCRGALDARHVAVAALVIVSANGAFLPALRSSSITVEQLLREPAIGYGQLDYLPNPRLIPAAPLRETHVIGVEATPPSCTRVGDTVQCAFVAAPPDLQVQLPVLYYPKLLDVEIDGQEVACVPLPWHTYLLAGVQLAPGPHDVRVRFRGLPWATRTSALAWAATLGGLAVALVARRRVVNS